MRRLFLVLGLIFGVSVGHAMKVKDVPNPRVERGSYVQDSAGLLGGDQISRLDGLSVELEAKTGAELAFVTIDNLGGDTVEDFADKLFQRFGVGKKSKDNGILILVAREDRRFRVEVGYGLEGVLPDGLCKRLMDQLAVPKFKQGNFGDGLYELGFALATKVAQSENVSLAPPSAPSADTVGTAGDAGETQVLGLMGSESPPAEGPFLNWYKWANGALIFVLTLVVVGWRTLRWHLSPSLAGKRLALGKDASAYPAKLVGLGAFGTIVYTSLIESGFPFLSLIGGAGAAVGLYTLWRKFYQGKSDAYRRFCESCRNPMTVVEEAADDRYLKEFEIDEEKAEGMDYEFWRCAGCATEERFNVKLPYARPCPKCGHRSLVVKDTVISSPTYESTGKRRIDKNCRFRKCLHAETIYKTIPKKTRSSSSSSGGGGGGSSFGGGSSGGGGASGGW